MRGWILGLIVFWTLVGLAACNAFGAEECAPRPQLLDMLAKQYGEASVARTTNNAGNLLIELYRTADGATWSLIGTNRDGKSCILAAGKDWTDAVPTVFPGKNSPEM